MREYLEGQIVRVAVLDEIGLPLSEGHTHYMAAEVTAPSYGSTVACRILSLCSFGGVEIRPHRTRLSPPGYRYSCEHSEVMALGGVACEGWFSYLLRDRDAMLMRVIVSPDRSRGWVGALGAFTYLAHEGVIDVKRPNQPFDVEDLESGFARWSRYRAEGKLRAYGVEP